MANLHPHLNRGPLPLFMELSDQRVQARRIDKPKNCSGGSEGAVPLAGPAAGTKPAIRQAGPARVRAAEGLVRMNDSQRARTVSLDRKKKRG